MFWSFAIYALCFSSARGFVAPSNQLFNRQRVLAIHANPDATFTDLATVEAEIRSMRVKEIKAELAKLNVSSQDAFEKEELVQRLLKARRNDSKKVKEMFSKTPDTDESSHLITVPLYFASLNSDLKVAAVNMDGGIRVNPSDQPYATIEIQVENDNGEIFSLRLLLDTACSGFVLRPSIVDKYDLPKLSTPVTMTSAGGTAGATGLTQLSKYSLGNQSFGPLPAAVQDIGALPKTLDGIIGLSFLSQFSVVDMDFKNGKVSFYPTSSPQPVDPNPETMVAKGSMEIIPQLGIYTTEVYLGSRGPVKMLVDSGAACSFLNWNGVEQLGIARNDNSFLQRLPNPTAAMGSDNVAMQLTHRIYVSSVLKIGTGTGLSLKDSKRLGIDIGNIAIIDSLRDQNVGGILGIDALMRCSSVRLIFHGAKKKIILFE